VTTSAVPIGLLHIILSQAISGDRLIPIRLDLSINRPTIHVYFTCSRASKIRIIIYYMRNLILRLLLHHFIYHKYIKNRLYK